MQKAENSIDFAKIERKWRKKWEDSGIFEVKESGKKKKYYVLEMFPYPSASGLHMGHALNYTIGDIYARFKIMQGFNVLHPMGFDSFGLPAENAAIKNKAHPKKFTEDAIKNYIEEMKELGFSYDWSRMVETHKPDYYKWDQWIFLKMFEKGLAYKKKSPVNFCPKCNTVLANEQVIGGRCWRHEDTNVEIKHLEQWFFKTTAYADELYEGLNKLSDWPELIKIMQRNWIGKSEGSEIVFKIKNNKKVILVDAVHCLVDEEGNVNLELKSYLDSLSNKKIILTNAPLEKHKKLFGKLNYEIFTLENKPNKKNSEYYGDFLKKFKLDLEDVIYFEHDKESVQSAKSIGINSIYYDGQLDSVKKFISDNLMENWPVFTTRADTLFGVTFMVVSAQHPKLMGIVTDEHKKEVEAFLKKIKSTKQEDIDKLDKDGVFIGSYAVHPITGEKIPVWAGNFVVADYGSGMVMAVPAHDQRDFDFAKKYKIPINVVVKHSREGSKIITITESLKPEFYKRAEKLASKIQNINGLTYIYTSNTDEVFALTKGMFVGSPWYVHSEGRENKILFHSEKEDKTFDWSDESGLKKALSHGGLIGVKKEQLDFHEIREAYTDYGVLINSGAFNDLQSDEARVHITKALEFKKLGKETTNYKLRDWLISRQRFWGTPIPIVYCDNCGVVPIPEKDLPVLLPEGIKFNNVKNPLVDYKPFVETKCPKCDGKARRETDTMDTFVNSSWYYLRYADSKNNKKIFEPEKAKYWAPIDLYIGGKEHACLHLIYIRFYTKFLRDLGLIKIDEPALRLFNQGMLLGSDGEKMSKSKGNVVLPAVVSEKYGMDAARLFLVSIASPDKDIGWSDQGAEGSSRFIKKIMDYVENAKIGKSSKRIESKLNMTIKSVGEDIEYMKYNFAVIKIRALFESLEEEIAKKDLESAIKLVAPFCPHIAEELWERIGGKGFVSLAEWPEYDGGKIDAKFEEAEKALEKTIGDVLNVLKIVKEKSEEAEKVYLYVLPRELEIYNAEELSRRIGKEVKVYMVNDKTKYDPEGKAGKAKPGKPGIYVE